MQLLCVTSIGSCFYKTTVRPCLLYGVECWEKQEAAAVLVENVCRRPKTAPLRHIEGLHVHGIVIEGDVLRPLIN